MPTASVRLAFVGTGGIARHHLNNLKKIEGNQIAGLCDVALDRAQALAKEFGGKAYNDLAQMLDESQPDALMICTPPFVRLEPIAAACERKLPFFCEKPPAFNLGDARTIRDLIAKHGTPHSIGFMYRHKQTTDRVKELLQGQKIIAVRSTFMNGPILNPDFPAWFKLQDRSGGPMVDQALHMLDTLRYVVGEIEQVFAFGSNRVAARGPEVTIHDTFNLALRFAGGLDGTHNHSWASKPGQVLYELLLQDGVLRVDMHSGNRMTGEVNGKPVEFAPQDDCYVTELERFLQAVRTKDFGAIRSTYADAVKTLAVCLAGIESAESGKPVSVRA